MRSFVVAAFVSISLAGCVERATVVDDRWGCEVTTLVEPPPSGCTTVIVVPFGAFGCTLEDPRGMPVAQHAGGLVRVDRPFDRAATVRARVVEQTAECSEDGGTGACTASITLTHAEGVPCACVVDGLDHYTFETESPELTLTESQHDLLLEPLGATFELTLCIAP